MSSYARAEPRPDLRNAPAGPVLWNVYGPDGQLLRQVTSQGWFTAREIAEALEPDYHREELRIVWADP